MNTPAIGMKTEIQVFNKPEEKTERFPINFETHVWKNIENSNSIVIKTIKVVSIVKESLKQKLSIIIARLGILSFVSLLYTLKSIPKTFQDFLSSIKAKYKDFEEILFHFSSLILKPGAILADLMTTLDSVNTWIKLPKIAFFSAIGLPLAIAAIGYGALKGIYEVFHYTLTLICLSQNKKDLSAYLSRVIDGDPKETKDLSEHDIKLIKDRNLNRLTRRSDKKACQIMQNLQKNLAENKTQEAQKNIRDIKTIVARKIVITTTSSLTGLALSAAMIASLFFTLPALLIPIIALSRAVITCARHLYVEHFLYKGI